jgi:predicted acyltransferase
MIFGLLAGGLLRSARTPADKVRRLVAFGVAGVALGTALHAAGVCPVVKRIWTPSWTIFSAGWVTLLLALFYGAIDVGQHRRWTLPFIVVGVNSIAMYALVHVATDYVGQSFLVHAGAVPFDILGESFRPALLGAATLLTFWGILAWMYRRRIFLRI